MTAFPQELRELAIAADQSQKLYELACKVFHAANPLDRIDETIARAMACKNVVLAGHAFSEAIEAYMASE